MNTIRRVYVAGPYSAATEQQRLQNIAEAVAIGVNVAALGALPVVPHHMSRPYAHLQPEPWWSRATMGLLRTCDALLLTPRWRESNGTVAEIQEAERLVLPVCYNMEQLSWCLQLDNTARV